MNLIKNINMILAFLLELSAIFILGYWGFSLNLSKIFRTIVGIMFPVLMIIIWGIWCAPKSTYRLEGIYLIIVKIAIFIIVSLCLIHLKHPIAATIFSFLVIINLGLSAYWKTL